MGHGAKGVERESGKRWGMGLRGLRGKQSVQTFWGRGMGDKVYGTGKEGWEWEEARKCLKGESGKESIWG